MIFIFKDVINVSLFKNQSKVTNDYLTHFKSQVPPVLRILSGFGQSTIKIRKSLKDKIIKRRQSKVKIHTELGHFTILLSGQSPPRNFFLYHYQELNIKMQKLWKHMRSMAIPPSSSILLSLSQREQKKMTSSLIYL